MKYLFTNGRPAITPISGRLMKSDIVFESGGRVTLATRNRGKGAERWLIHLQGKKHIQSL